MDAYFSSIGSDFTVSFGLKDLKKEQKINLLYDLMDEMGLRGLVLSDVNMTVKFNEALNRYCGK